MAPPRDESFFTRLTRLFRSGPSIRRKVKGYDDSGYYDKQAILANKSSGNGMTPFRKGTGHGSTFSMLGGSDMMSRTTRYQEFCEMEYTPIISKALDIQADEACSGDENGKNFHIYSDNTKIKENLEELFYDILNVDFNLRVWIRNLLKYGDLFLYNEVAPGVGVVNCMAMSVNEVERDEGFDANDPYAVRFKWHKLGQKTLENWQVTHFRIQGNDQFAPYGTSILESARRFWRQYVMMIDAMMIYRIVRSPERRVFYVDVGTVGVNEIPNYMQTVMSTIRGNMTVDKQTGRMDERFNATDVLEDYVVPVRGANSGTKIDTLNGGTHQTATEDIEMIQSQLFAALGVPKAYLGFDEMLSSKATLAQEDIRFSRTIQIIQKIVISELNKLAILHLYAKGFDGEDLIDFELRLSNPSSIALQQKLDLWKTKIDIIGAVDQIESRFLPQDWLYKEILGFTKDEIKGIREALKADKRFAAELNAITEPDTTGGNTVDPFDGSTYALPGGSPTQDNSIPASTANGVATGVYDPGTPSGDPDGVLQFNLSPGVAPLKANPQVRMDKKNAARRESDLEKQSDSPDFQKMLSPRKNPSLRDVYDSEFLKNPLNEDIKKELRAGASRKAYVSKEIKGLLENFDRSNRIVKNELPMTINLITENSEPESNEPEETQQSFNLIEDIITNLVIEPSTAPPEQFSELDELLSSEVSIPVGSENLPTLTELAELGLDLKDSSGSKEH